MARFGYTLMTEQAGPKELVRHAVRAEEVGFDFEDTSFLLACKLNPRTPRLIKLDGLIAVPSGQRPAELSST